MTDHASTTQIGIDGGQSGLRVRATHDPRVAETRAVAQLDADLAASYAEALLAVRAITDGRRVSLAVAGLSALPHGDADVRVVAATIAETLGADEVWVCNDAVTAHAAAFGGEPGVVLVAGTGVACLAVGDAGEPRIVDGAGYLVDDDGGAFRLGSHGLRAAVRAHDGRGPVTSLLAAACAAYACEPGELPEAVHRRARAATDVAAFARAVLDESSTDAVARSLVDEAAHALVTTTLAALRYAGDVDVAVAGRLLDTSSPLHAAYVGRLAASGVDGSRVRPASPPVDGALWLAQRGDAGRYAGFVTRHGRLDVVRAPGVAARRYLDLAGAVLAEASDAERPAIEAAASAIADCVQRGGMLHTFGTGHSHLLAEEVFYRAGGLARVNPILEPELMLHVGAVASTAHERRSGYAAEILERHPMSLGDVVVVASNSGGNTVTVELAQLARERGATVVALTSVRHATSPASRESSGPRLHELADVVLDNHGVPGDAVLHLPGLDSAVAPTSTVVGAALLQAVVAETVAILVERGVDPEVFRSANTAGGDEANAVLVARYATRVEAL